MLPLEPIPIVNRPENTDIEIINKLIDAMVNEPTGMAGFSETALLRLDLHCCWLSGQIRHASSGHWPSAELCVKNTVGIPRVSTIEISVLLCLNQLTGSTQATGKV